MRLIPWSISALAPTLLVFVQCIQADGVPSTELLPPKAPDAFQRPRRTVNVPSFALEAPQPQAHESFLEYSEAAKEIAVPSTYQELTSDPVTYLIAPVKESEYNKFNVLGIEVPQQELIPPLRDQFLPFRYNVTATEVLYSTAVPTAEVEHLTVKPEMPHLDGSNNTFQLPASIVEAKPDAAGDIAKATGNELSQKTGLNKGNATEESSDRTKRFILPEITISTGGGGCCSTCGRCGGDGFPRLFRGRYGRGRPRYRGYRGRRVLPALPLYDDYDYGDACGDCGRK